MTGDVPSTVPVDLDRPGGPPPRLALYRRYRPATFAEVKGQDHVTEPLRQALRTGRVNHAYLFSGPRGCGKTSSARILARSLNCAEGPTPDPCGKCESCVALAPDGPGSLDVIEIDAASHGGVDDARDLRERAFYSPVSGRFKIYIIDEAHMVTREGFNALLKLVEEPPPHLKFVFATTEPEKVIATIRSRTHHYPFRLVPPAILRELLEEILSAEQIAYEPAVLPLVVRAGAGSARDSLSVLDQLLAGAGEEGLRYDRTVALLGYTDENLLDEVADAFANEDGAAVFRAVNRVMEGGHDPRRFAADLLDRFRDLIVLAAVPGAALAIGYTQREAARRAALALLAGVFFSLSFVTLLYDAGVGPHAPDTWARVAGSGPLAAGGFAILLAATGGLVLLRPARFLAVAVGAGVALRVLGLLSIPLTLRLGDMLPLIGLATGHLLQAQNPYLVYHMPWELPLTYWPLTLLSYVPVAAAGLDLRLVNLLCGPLIGALLLLAGGRRGPGPAAHAYGLLYLTPTMLQWDLSTAAPPYWCWLCAAFAAAVVAARRPAGWLLPGFAAGAALAAGPLALPFLPFLGAAWLQAGWRSAARRALAAAAALALIVAPFLLWDAAGFWNGAVAWFNDLDRLPLLKWQSDRSWAFEIGLAGPLWQAGLQGLLKPLQIAFLAGLFGLSQVGRPRPLGTPAAALRWGAAAYLLFMIVNPVIWPYLYVPALLALIFALVPAGDAA